MFTYWVNVQISGSDPFSYHVLNVLIHLAAAILIYFIVRRLLEWGGVEPAVRTPLAGFCALLFLLHPVETEAVAYLAGRSEVFELDDGVRGLRGVSLRQARGHHLGQVGGRDRAVSGSACVEGADHRPSRAAAADRLLVEPGLFLQAAFGENWRLYVPLALGAVAGVVRFAPLIFNAQTAGFGMKDLTWYQYLFTEFRAIFVYIREFFLPFGLNADWDFPISHSIFDRGAIFGLIALLALMGAAWHYRKRFPLASYGFFAFLVLMPPTSSILPIRDPVAERRLYFASIGSAAGCGGSGTTRKTAARYADCGVRGASPVGRCGDSCARRGVVIGVGAVGGYVGEIAG